MIKFYGSQEEFANRLDSHFKSADKGKTVGNHFRYECVYNNSKLNINLYENGTVQCQPSNDEIVALVKSLLEGSSNNKHNNASSNISIQVVQNENSDYIIFNGVKYVKEQ